MSSQTGRIHLDNTFGALFLGQTVAASLWGVTIIQAWYYYNRYSKDVWHLKCLVYFTLVLDTVHQCLITHAVYHFLVSNYDNPEGLLIMVPSVMIEVFITGLTGLLVQGFLTYRCWRLTNKNWFIVACCSAATIAEFVTSVVFAVLALKLKTWEDLKRIKGLSMSINGTGAVASVLIAATLVYNLKKSNTGVKRTDTTIRRLITYAINTGGLTSVCACASFIAILIVPNGLIHGSIYFLLGRLYTNSMLATLNARKDLKGKPDESDHISLSASRFASDLTDTKVVVQAPQSPQITIKVDTRTDFMTDSRDRGDDSDFKAVIEDESKA